MSETAVPQEVDAAETEDAERPDSEVPPKPQNCAGSGGAPRALEGGKVLGVWVGQCPVCSTWHTVSGKYGSIPSHEPGHATYDPLPKK